MLKRLADRVRLRAYAENPLHPPRTGQPAAVRSFRAGEEVLAYVESELPGGLCKVLIEGQPFTLRLPCHAGAGDVVHLTVTAHAPLLKFALNEPPGTPVQAVCLSDAARFITALLAESEKLPMAVAPASGNPLLTRPPGQGASLAAALHRALDESGLFYESHLAQWMGGVRPLARLLNEPQAHLSLVSSRASVMAHGGDTHINANSGSAELPVHRDALPIVKQQLDALNDSQVTWHGLIWPGQPVEWQIRKRQGNTTTARDSTPWQMRIRLTLPGLREVDATLLIDKQGVAITVRTALSTTANLLEKRGAILRQALHTAGIEPKRIVIHAHAPS